jgi:asparagine synthase (glutamine-hydrolysing)
MCGICGIVSTHDRVERATIERMNQTLVHRGPDSDGILIDGNAALAARRLAIIDLQTGDQPIANEDRTIHVIQNGEIYNYRELRQELEAAGHRFRTQSDTEVLVHLYEECGLKFAERLRGMFAIAVWDRPRKRLVLARDRFGIKPLYYNAAEGTLAFASELKALLCRPEFSRAIDFDGLEAYLAFSFVPAPLTIFRDAKKLPPGTLLVWDDGALRLERYARPRPLPADATRAIDEEEAAEELRARLADSVRAHLIADVPVGILLSGGIDSSTLAALAALETPRISTFTIGFDERGFDERDRARAVARRYDTDHHELIARPNAIELLPELAEIFDEPFADNGAIPTFIVSRLARQHVKVVLSGEGGDELFGGYNYYTGHLLARRFRAVAPMLRPLVERLPVSTASPSTLEHRAKTFVRGAHLSLLERHQTWKEIFSADARAELRRRGSPAASHPIELLRERYEESNGAEDLARAMDLDLGIFLVDDMLVKTDRASMANSLEARVPMLDPLVADFALALPTSLKVRRLEKKRLMRHAVEPLLPREVLEGRKQGFAIPIGKWLRYDLQPFVREMLSAERIREQGFFEPETVTRLVEAHSSGARDHSRRLWSLLVFSLWHERYAGSASAG